MLYYTGLLFLAIAVSIDGFGVGVTYGMREVKVPLRALLLIMILSGSVLLISMTLGDMLAALLSTNVAEDIGGVILIALGLFSLMNVIRSNRSRANLEETEVTSHNKLSEIKSVLSTPDKADLDKSGKISLGEALLLGLALSLDAFGAGIGASLLGYTPLVTAILIASMSGIFLYSGMKIGLILSKNERMKKFSYLAPVLLIGIGIMNLI